MVLSTPQFSFLGRRISFIFIHIRGKAFDTANFAFAFYGKHFVQVMFDPFAGTAAEMAFATFGSQDDTATGHAETFGRGLMRFNFVFSCFGRFTRHNSALLTNTQMPQRSAADLLRCIYY
jgi:hypothetical protein